MSDSQKQFPSLDVIFELAKEKLHFQSEQWNAIDQKNAIVLAVYGIILAVLAAVDVKNLWIFPKFVVVIGLLIWLSLIIAGIACSIASLMPRDIDMPPNIPKLLTKYLKTEEYDTKNVLLSTFEKSITENDKIIEKKAKYLGKSIKYFLPLSLGVCIIVVIFNQTLGGN